MSAFQVGSAHLAYLVGVFRYADAHRDAPTFRTGTNPGRGIVGRQDILGSTWWDLHPNDPAGARVMFDRLAEANAYSVGYRYGGEKPPPVPFPGAAPGITCDNVARVAAAMKALDCYEYQSCEPPTWRESEEYAWCRDLRRWLLHKIPGFASAYNAAPWSIMDSVDVRSVTA